jgi:Na+-transporting NADH:ubiquinone oxidoreductase subunit NqrF
LKDVGGVVGKYAGWISNVITGGSVVYELLSNSTYINQITDGIFNISSKSREGVTAKYVIYSGFVQTLVDKKIVTYTTSWGTLDDYKVDWDKFDKLKKELKIDEAIANICEN